ncbi:hypothetical protein Tco_1017213 [Tanacetum coccineum]|uniref:Uncharacterized protein n=1 Tax=Tanacetum coccineum TaxID=301880 RepID=A0ABQ5FS75_9ASTR
MSSNEVFMPLFIHEWDLEAKPVTTVSLSTPPPVNISTATTLFSAAFSTAAYLDNPPPLFTAPNVNQLVQVSSYIVKSEPRLNPTKKEDVERMMIDHAIIDDDDFEKMVLIKYVTIFFIFYFGRVCVFCSRWRWSMWRWSGEAVAVDGGGEPVREWWCDEW